MSSPWMKWYPSDWRADPKLRICSLAARGLWMDMLALMHEAEPYGHLLVGDCAPTDKQLASLVGASPREVACAVSELQDAGVFSRTDGGVIYSRRMVRDKAKAEQDRANGKRGGNPRIKGADNGGVNPLDKAQKPEARSQKPERDADASLGAREADFDSWYTAYPRHEGRGQAAKAYRAALKKADAETLLAGARAAAKRYASSEKRFIPMPATWLNGERWLDDSEPDGERRPGMDEICPPEIYRGL